MLLDGWLGDREERVRRVALLVATGVIRTGLALALDAVARTMQFTSVTADDWVEHAALDALATSVILHVGVGRRWPFLRHDALVERR